MLRFRRLGLQSLVNQRVLPTQTEHSVLSDSQHTQGRCLVMVLDSCGYKLPGSLPLPNLEINTFSRLKPKLFMFFQSHRRLIPSSALQVQDGTSNRHPPLSRRRFSRLKTVIVTHKSHASVCRKRPGLLPACKPRCAYRRNANQHTGKDR